MSHRWRGWDRPTEKNRDFFRRLDDEWLEKYIKGREDTLRNPPYWMTLTEQTVYQLELDILLKIREKRQGEQARHG